MQYFKIIFCGHIISTVFGSISIAQKDTESLPNIILVMADDLGYGDVAYTGNPTVLTPNLDMMAKQGIRFDRFYSAGPVSTPTRASCLTGRHPSRMNMDWADSGALPREEVTIAEALKKVGYITSHIGKWHVGQLSKTFKQGYGPYPVDPQRYSPPWENGFDVSFSCHGSVPTFNPYYLTSPDYDSGDFLMVMDKPVEYGQREGGFIWRDRFWEGPGQFYDEWLEGPLPEILMDRALDFIQSSIEKNEPFLSLIWFSTPHTPVVAGPEQRALYADLSIEEQHGIGRIPAMDEQIGRLRSELEIMGISDNTIIWFCSDNGPSWVHDLNSAGPLRGQKATLWEGGIRVPAIIEWPARFKTSKIINIPVVTNDILPTLLAITGQNISHDYPMDGIDITNFIEGDTKLRQNPIGFQSPALQTSEQSTAAWLNVSGQQYVWMDDQYKLISVDDGNTWMLFDMFNDIGEENDLSGNFPDLVKSMKDQLFIWLASCQDSSEGKDY